MRHFLHTWLRPSLLYALVALFVVWTMAPVVWIGTMSVQPEINYVSVPPHLSISDFSLRWYNEMLSEPDVAAALRNSVITPPGPWRWSTSSARWPPTPWPA